MEALQGKEPRITSEFLTCSMSQIETSLLSPSRLSLTTRTLLLSFASHPVCSHAFCKACIEEVIKTNAKCPMDRNAIGMGSLVSLPAEIVKDEGDEATPEPEQAPEDRSAKANMLVTIIKTIHQAAPQRKSRE